MTYNHKHNIQVAEALTQAQIDVVVSAMGATELAPDGSRRLLWGSLVRWVTSHPPQEDNAATAQETPVVGKVREMVYQKEPS